MNRTGVVLLFCALLPGCSLFSPKPPDVIVKPEPVPILCNATQQKPESLDLKDTPPTVVFDTESETWGYWFSPDLYAAIAENIQAMRRYMNQQRKITATIVDCIDDHNSKVKKPAE